MFDSARFRWENTSMKMVNFTDIFRPLFDSIIFPFLGWLLPLLFALFGIVVACVGFATWFVAAAFFILWVIAYFFYLQPVEWLFYENIFIVLSWIALVLLVWSHEIKATLVRSLWLLGVMPIIYNFTQALVAYVFPRLGNLDFFSLEGWMEIVKDKNIVVMFTHFFAVGDLCICTLMLFYSMSLIKPRMNKLVTTIVMFITVVVGPLGLLIFLALLGVGILAPILYLSFSGLDTPENIFIQISSIGIGWIGALLYAIFSSKSVVMNSCISLLFVCGVALPVCNHVKILFLYQAGNAHAPERNFLTIYGWMHMFEDKYILVAGLSHLAVCGLSIAYLMVAHFNTVYNIDYKKSFGYFVLGKVFIFLMVIVAIPFPPVAILLYFALCWFIPEHCLYGYKKPPEILDKREIHFGENLPLFPRFVFYVFKALAGIFFLFAHLYVYILFLVFIYFYSYFVKIWKPLDDNPTYRQFSDPSFLTPALVRNLAGQMRVHLYSVPHQKRGILWSIRFHILQFAAIVEIAPNANTPSTLSGALATQFGGVFPFADGIGIADREKVREYLADPYCRKGPRSLAGTVTTTQSKFSLWSTITMGLAPLSEGEKVKAARKILFAWLKEFDFNFSGQNPTFISMTDHFPPLVNGKLPTDDELFNVFGDVLYWMATPNVSPGNHRATTQTTITAPPATIATTLSSSSSSSSSFNLSLHGTSNADVTATATATPVDTTADTTTDMMATAAPTSSTPAFRASPTASSFTPSNHGQLSRNEKVAFLTLATNLFQFFPNWFNFMLFGGFFERQVNDALYTIRNAFYRDKGAAYEAAMREGAKEGVPPSEVLRLIVSVYCIAGAAVPSKIIVAVLKRIAADPIKMEISWKKNKHAFIKECARLDPAVFWVNLFTHKTEIINNIPIQEHTPCHLYIPFANLDTDIFGPNPLNFDPIAARVEKIFTWNGLEGALHEYPRGCPGHDVAIQALILIVDYYLPMLVNAVTTFNNAVDNQLDPITKSVVSVTTLRSYDWSAKGYVNMQNFSNKDLEMSEFYGFTTPTFDEDFRNNLTFVYDFVAQCLTLIPVFDYVTFVPDDAARDWRKRHLTYFPRPTNVYNEDVNDSNTDDIVTRLAFFGLGCHKTEVYYPPTTTTTSDSKEEKHNNNISSNSSSNRRSRGGSGSNSNSNNNNNSNSVEEMLSRCRYVNDTSALGEFEVRKGFVQYGATCYFDELFRPIAIYLSFNKKYVFPPFLAKTKKQKEDEAQRRKLAEEKKQLFVPLPEDIEPTIQKPEWAYAKWVWKCSLFTFVTIHDHLLECHLIKANVFVTLSRQVLSLNHPLRIILKPFTYHTIYVNQLAGRTLIGPNALAARVFAFRDVNEVLKTLKKNFVYKPVWVGMYGDDAPPKEDFPLKYDYMQLWKIVHCYMYDTLSLLEDGKEREEAITLCESLMQALHIPPSSSSPSASSGEGKEDSKHSISTSETEGESNWPPRKYVRLLTDLIMNGTGIHEQVGTISYVQVLPNLTGAKLVESMTSEPTQSYALNTALTSSTGIDQPKLLDDWSYLLVNLKKKDEAAAHYLEFKQKLVAMSLEVNARKTEYPFDSFDPRVLETAVSR